MTTTLVARLEERTPPRVARVAKYCVTGGTGVAVDMAVFLVALEGMHYLPASVVAWSVAVSWNFTLDWAWTFERPAGSLVGMWSAYVGAQLLALAVRTVATAGAVELGGAVPVVGNLVGIGVGAIVGFAVSDGVVFER